MKLDMTTLSPNKVTLATVIPFVAPKLMTKKYVIVDFHGVPSAILLEAQMGHDSVITMMLNQWARRSYPQYPVLAAGYYSIRNGVVEVSGSSHSLGVSSRPEDAEIIRKLLAEDAQ
jgi:hypothetical protein